MRFLGIGEYCDLGDLYLRLARDGHEVRIFVSAEESRETLGGLIERVPDWAAELPWIKSAGPDGIIVFEGVNAGHLQDRLRKDGYNVIGGSEFGDRLESDRAFGQHILRSVGIKTAPTFPFTSYAAGVDHIRAEPARYVYKPNGDEFTSMDSYVGQLDDGADVADFLNAQQALATPNRKTDFILMAHVQGVEVGVGAYFNGVEFLKPACIDFEHKRFFPGNLGELTGEMGTVATYRGAETLFDATLAKLADLLAASGYCGYINLNMIVNEEGIWPLEFTSRFGYPGFAVLNPLQTEDWATLFKRLCQRTENTFDTRDGYTVGVVLTIPPFPYLAASPPPPTRLPILFRGPLSPEEEAHIHYSEVALVDKRLVTVGVVGQVMVVTGYGQTVPEAQRAAYRLAAKVAVPNLRYRIDIGELFIARDQSLLRDWNIVT